MDHRPAPAITRTAEPQPFARSPAQSALTHRWLAFFAAASIALLLSLAVGLLWVQRQAALDLAQAQAQREVRRLAAELEQSLRLARALIAQDLHSGTPDPKTDARPQLDMPPGWVAALNLPFELTRVIPDDSAPPAPEDQWLPGLVQPADAPNHLPLSWQPSAGPADRAYELRLSRDAVLARFASEGLPPTGSMSLFRLEDNGATTILVRYPTHAHEQGMTLYGHVAAAVARAPSGVIRVTAVIDGIERVVGYHRLGSGAERLLVVYALPIESVLATWTRTLPGAALVTLLLAATMAYGAWRLDRSLHALRASERHFQTLSDHLPDVVTRYDAQGRVLYVNPAIEQATGQPANAVIGRHIRDLAVPPALLAMWQATLTRVVDTGISETLHHAYPGPDGPRQWEARVMREPNAPGTAPSVLVISRDITDRLEAENRRRSAQQLFESVFLSAPEAMSLSDWSTGRFLLVNDAFCALFGRARDHLLGRTAVDLGLWRAAQARQQLLDRLVRGERVRDVPGTSLRPGGETIEMRYSAERVEIDGQVCLLLLFRDVTQQERDQRALARSELRFRLAAEHGQVWEWDLEQGSPPKCDEFFAVLGYPPPGPTPSAETALALLHPEDLPQLRRTLERFLKGEIPGLADLRVRDALGQTRWFELRGSAQRNARGRVTYMAGTLFEITDRKRLQDAQRQTLEQLETIASASPAMLWTTDSDQQPTWMNQAWLAFTGRDLPGECAAFWLDDLHPEDRERCAHVFQSANQTRSSYSMEYRMQRHDGAFRWLLEQGRPRWDGEQRFVGFIGSCLDVTELREAEATATERGALLEQVFDVLNELLFVVDAEERFVHYQADSDDLLYRSPEDFLGQRIEDVMPQHLLAPLREAMASARQAGVQTLDYSLDLPSGTQHFSARLAWLPNGDQCMFLVRNITTQQEALQERERLSQFVLLLFRLASRFINLPIGEMDTAIQEALGDMGRFVSADRAYLFEYDFEAGTNSNTHEWCAEGVEPEQPRLQHLPIEWGAEWVQAHRRGEVVHIPQVHKLPAGALKDLLVTQGIRSLITLPLMADDRCLGYVGLDSVAAPHTYDADEIALLQLFAQMLVNVQERSLAQARLGELNEQLERKVRERTRQLHASVQRLQAANRELESFTYSASHDLRTPLRGIEGFCALLLEENAHQLDAQGQVYLQRIQRSTLHMSQLINDLLAYARLEQMTERAEPVHLRPMVMAVTQAFEEAVQQRGGRLQVTVGADLQAQVDPRAMAMVLRNLLENALKFTPPDRAPIIRIDARVDAEFIELRVADNGQGFDMKHHDRIFGMFQRLHRQDQIPGTGIGLALVSKAVERMGGRIWAVSTPGEGSVFHFSVPMPNTLTGVDTTAMSGPLATTPRPEDDA